MQILFLDWKKETAMHCKSAENIHIHLNKSQKAGQKVTDRYHQRGVLFSNLEQNHTLDMRKKEDLMIRCLVIRRGTQRSKKSLANQNLNICLQLYVIKM